MLSRESDAGPDPGAAAAAGRTDADSDPARRLAQTVLDASPALTAVVGPDGTVRTVNARWTQVTAELGIRAAPGADLRAELRAIPPAGRPAVGLLLALDSVLDRGTGPAEAEVELIDQDGRPRSFEAHVARLPPDVGGAVVVLLDLSARRTLERQLAHRAQSDPLTGIPNRALLVDALARAISRGQRTGRSVAALFCDLDHFKDVNDTLGHEVGDRVLREVADRLVSACRAHDLVARFGGDEFVVVVEDVSGLAEVLPLAERILASLAEPFRLGTHDIVLGISVGVAVSEPGRTSVHELLSESDVAMYRAKEEGRHRVVVFEPSMRDRVRTRLAMASALRHAVQRDELELVFQPVAALDRPRLLAVEAFVRWQFPGRGLLTPDAFLAAAEESGAIIGLGEWVLDRAVGQLAAWGTDLPAPARMAVNLSPRQVADPGLTDLVAAVLERHGVPAPRLALEVTESALIEEPHRAAEALRQLASLGVAVVVDDFGTGLSSLARLEDVTLDALKIDRRLVARVDREPRAEALLRAVVALGHALGIQVVAEGVERPEQRARVADAGCDGYQGYLLARPLPAAQVVLQP